jgi:homogentisate 1,2-dioxygenase
MRWEDFHMMRSWIHFTRGRFVRQARVGLGDLREEHLSRQGFAGPVAMLYRTDGPNEVVRVEGDYRSRAVDSADVVSADASDPRGGPQILLSNQDVAVAISRRRQAMPYCCRDVTGDLLYFVHRGSGTFATEFGPIAYEPGDWVLLPKSTTFRQLPDDRDHILMVVESPGPIAMAEHENVGRHTPVDPTMLEVPDVVDYRFPAQPEYEVRLRHAGGQSAIFYKNDPLKVVGWKGDLFPFKLNVRHILPIMSDRLHIPPSSWVTFEAPGFCVLTIPPQIAVSDLEAEELPSYHRNIDMDEVMLTHADEDPAGRRPGGFRHTPQGILHGATEAYRAEFQARRKPGQRRTATNVGVDTYRPLAPSPEFVKLSG